jgi:galactokinase
MLITRTVEATNFELYKRAKHVYEEALRVLQFQSICLTAGTGMLIPISCHSTRSYFLLMPQTGSTRDALIQLGNLMNASQNSCAQQFECSHPRLDELTSLARSAGALGARLTGAGWGGCAVALVEEDKVQGFINFVASGYEPYRGLEGATLSEVLFATKPSAGACGECRL